jgi:hypothetical protein
MDEKSKLEKISGSLAAGAASTAIGALGATVTPLAAFVPFLVQTLASGRHSKRLEKAISEIESILEQHSDEIKNVSDDQYKIINEAIAAAFYTINQEKLNYLVKVVENSTNRPEDCNGFSDPISRVIRDISAAEILFIVNNFHYEGVTITNMQSTNERLFVVEPGSNEEVLVSGLINLGLFYAKDTTWDSQVYSWSPIVVKILNLVKTHNK